jgi:hypothetical protein
MKWIRAGWSYLQFRKFLTIEYVPRITDFCFCTYVLGFSIIIIIIIIIICIIVTCHRPFLPGTSLEPAVIPTAQASSFTLQYFPYYV